MDIKYFILLACFLFLSARPVKGATGLGVTDGRLAPCPRSPNCVSSQSEGRAHYIEPLHFTGSLKEAKEALLSVIRSEKRTRLITITDDYIHAEFTSLIFRFVDDVEFYFDDSTKTIHVRSASRVGRSDLGVNRKRVEKIRGLFNREVKKE